MVHKKKPRSLRHFCLKAVPRLISGHIRVLAQKAGAAKWYSLMSGGDEGGDDREAILRRQVDHLKRHVYENVVWYDYEDVFRAVLQGVEDALGKTRKGWRPDADMAQYRQEMEALSLFAEVVLFSRIRRLDFGCVPKSLRSRVVDSFSVFSNLRSLVLGSGTGGQWLFSGSIAKSVAAGMEQMRELESLSCRYDCTPEMLEVLSRTCAASMKVLDVEGSKKLDDTCLGSILAMNNLQELHLFNTKISDEAGAQILLRLPKLTRLVKADFLCESLGWIDYLEEEEADEGGGPKFLQTEFFPSQKYYFHEEWQMEMVSRLCPFISKMFFIFHETCVPDFTVLSSFEYLTELCLFGGSFYTDKLDALLEIRGGQLTSLSLMSVSKVDFLAVALISRRCPNLQSFSLINCETGEPRPAADPNSDEAYEGRQAYLSMATAAQDNIADFSQVTEVTLHSKCRKLYLTFLLCRCPNAEVISLGPACQVDDEAMLKVYACHGLARLKEFHCESMDTRGLTLDTARMLTAGCPELKTLADLQSWKGTSPAEVGKFRERCYEANLDLDMRSHQRLRQILEMRGSERRSHFNLIAGPTVERMRMAREQQLEQET